MKFDAKAITKSVGSIAQSAKFMIAKRFPEILTVTAISSMVVCVVSAVKETPKAMKLVEQEKERQQVDKLPAIDIVKVTWKCYTVSALAGAASIACIIGANTVHNKRNAALAAAYALSETSLKEYKDKIEKVLDPEDKEKVEEAIAKDAMDNHPYDEAQVIHTLSGTAMCFDKFSGRYFTSNPETIKAAFNAINYRLMIEGFISINEFYSELGLDETGLGNEMGWRADDGLVEPKFTSRVLDNGMPCLVVDFFNQPTYRYSELFL